MSVKVNLENLKSVRGFRIPEAAAYMGIAPWRVEVLVRSKELPALRISRGYTILRDDCDAYLDRRRAAVSR